MPLSPAEHTDRAAAIAAMHDSYYGDSAFTERPPVELGILHALLALQPEEDPATAAGLVGCAIAEVTGWDVENGDVLGATIVCGTCRGAGCETCSRSGELFRAYELPGGRRIDLHRDADVYAQVPFMTSDDEAPRDA